VSDLERDLEALEAADPEVKAAAERLDNVSRNIIATAAAAGESTSARLRRVEQERDEARAAVSNALRCFDDLQTAAGRKYQELSAERDVAQEQRDLARAELASAKTELGHLRRERDQLRADLTAALDELLRLGHGTWIVEGGGEQKS
jgi:phage-related minor tail protein